LAPEVSSSRETILHQDTVPLPVSAPGAPATVSAPLRSLYQTDSVAVKVRLSADWALRDPQGLAWLSAGAW
jgi:hypothetical protein